MKAAGWASTPTLDSYRHVVAPGAFDASIRKYGLQGPKGIKLLWAHDSKFPLGAITKLETRGNGLWIECDVLEEISYGKDVALASKAAGGLSFSVGFFLVDADVVENADGSVTLLILKGDLFEVSVVVFPANTEAGMVEVDGADTKAAPTDPIGQALALLARVTLGLKSLDRKEPTADLSAVIAEMKRLVQ